MDKEREILLLYQELLGYWNERNAHKFAALFQENGTIVGFDGSQHNGQAQIESDLSAIFSDHPTAAFVGLVREVRFLSAEIALLRAVAGMIPPGKSEISPAANAVQSLVAVRFQEEWRIAHFQNTPAQFHGRPELSEQLTKELNEALKGKTKEKLTAQLREAVETKEA